jgi:hypothetical protein
MRHFLISKQLALCALMLLAGSVSAQTTLTPAAPKVNENSSITITSSVPVNWSLAGAGSLGSVTATSVTYTAPASVIPKNAIYGCPVGPNDSVFNTRIDSLPVNSNSGTWITNSSALGISVQPSWGITYADASTPAINWKFYYGGGFTGVMPPQVGPDLRRENGNFIGGAGFDLNTPTNGLDHHIMAVRRSDCTFYETYHDRLQGVTINCRDTTPGCNSNSGIAYAANDYLMSPQLLNYGSTDAAGLPLAPLTWRLDEIKAGSIRHAVRFTTAVGYVSRSTFLWPATSVNGGIDAGPPLGARFRLKSSFNVAGKCNSGNTAVDAYCTTMLTALQQYGMILADIGTSNAIQSTAEVVSDPNVVTAMAEMSGVAFTNFEAIDESSLQGATANSYRVNPANGFITPDNFSVLTATPTAGTPVTVPIAIQGAAIGLKSNQLYVLAGTPAYQIVSWVNGAANQSVTWTKISGVGSIAPTGAYTAPATTGGGASATVQGTSSADSNAVAYVYVTILPVGSNPAGSIRIDVGNPNSVTDGSGIAWLPDQALTSSAVVQPTPNGDYPHWSSTSPERIIYESVDYTYGNDLDYRFIVPNGNYKIRFMEGYSGCLTCGSFGAYMYYSSPAMFEANGQIGAHSYDWGLPIAYQYGVPTDIYIPAKVVNETLYVAYRPVANEIAPYYSPPVGKGSYLGGLEIIPDATPPHWAIDTQQQTTIRPGQTLAPFFVIDWYTGVNDPAWSIVSGPPGASISSGGVLSLAAGSYFNAQPVTVRATDGTYTANATVYTASASRFALGIIPPAAPVNHYAYKRSITINPTRVGATDQSNFPVEVSISDPTLATVANGGHVQNANGYDIEVTSDSAGTTKLAWEVEKYNNTTGTWIAHVRVPTVSHTVNTTFYVLYGNPSASTNQQNASAVWDSNFTAVYHLTSLTQDSTSNAANATNNGSTANPSGQIAGAATFSSIVHDIATPASALPATRGTISMWIDSSQANSSGYMGGRETDASGSFYFLNNVSGSVNFGWDLATDYRIVIPDAAFLLPANSWHHVVYSWDATAPAQKVFLDGVQAGATLSTPFSTYAASGPFLIGGPNSYTLLGSIDEARFSNIVRSPDWITTEYNNQFSPATFAAIGAEQSN